MIRALKRIAVTVLTAGLVAGTLSGVTAAYAQGGQGQPAGEAVARQLIAAADKVKTAAAADAGFAEVRIDTDHNEVVVYRVDDAASAVTSRYRSVPTDGIPVRIAPAVLSQAQVNELNNRLDADWRGLKQAGIEIQHYGPGVEGGPFQIGVKDAGKHRASLLARYGIFGAHTVSIEESEARQFSRQNDSPPYWGGAWIKQSGVDPATDGCTSGFGAYSRTNGDRYIITAYHCVRMADRRFWDGGNDLMGSATAWNPEFDAAFIKVSSAPKVYDGAWNDPGYHKPVTAARAPVGGESLCSSGSYSGVRCGGVVQGRGTFPMTHPTTGHQYEARGWWVLRTDGQSFGGDGDSGGPVFHAFTADVEAKGLIVGGVSPWTPCTGRLAAARTCSDLIFISDITEIAAARNLDLTRP